MSRSIHISIAMLLAVQAAPPAVTADTTHNGQGVAYWRTRTQPQFTLAERQDAIFALASIAQKETSLFPVRPGNFSWVETEIVPTMISLLHDKDPAIRRKTVKAFELFPQASHSAVEPLIQLLGDQDDYIRTVASRNLVAIEPNEAGRVIPVLVDVVHKSDSFRGYAADALSHIRPEGAKALAALLSDQNPAVRAVAIGSLTWCGPPTELGLPVLRQLLLDDRASVRAHAVAVASQMRPPTQEAVSAIMPLLQDKHAGVRSAVLNGLSKMHADPTQVLPEMVKLVDDPDDHYVWSTLADSLGAMGPAAVPTLTKLLEDNEARVRARAADSLGRIGPPAKDAVPALKHHLTDMSRIYYTYEGMRVCHRAGEALVRILGDKSYLEGLPALPIDGK